MNDAFPIGTGAIAGAIWNVASLLCLSRLLKVWLGPHPSWRAAIAWVLLKITLLGLVLMIFTRVSTPFVIGFGLGFTATLAIAIWRCLLHTRRLLLARAHGR